MHGDELKYITEAYETNWMSTVGANINSAEAEIAAKVGCKYLQEQNYPVLSIKR